jgi:hypothetical protein
MALTQSSIVNLLLCSIASNFISVAAGPAGRVPAIAGAAFFAFKAFVGSKKIKAFDKKQSKFEVNRFTGEDKEKK